MHKLKLEMLAVETFATLPASGAPHGTVEGQQASVRRCIETYDAPTCPATCDYTCGNTCDYSCAGTCAYTCDDPSCATCLTYCGQMSCIEHCP